MAVHLSTDLAPGNCPEESRLSADEQRNRTLAYSILREGLPRSTVPSPPPRQPDISLPLDMGERALFDALFLAQATHLLMCVPPPGGNGSHWRRCCRHSSSYTEWIMHLRSLHGSPLVPTMIGTSSEW